MKTGDLVATAIVPRADCQSFPSAHIRARQELVVDARPDRPHQHHSFCRTPPTSCVRRPARTAEVWTSGPGCGAGSTAVDGCHSAGDARSYWRGGPHCTSTPGSAEIGPRLPAPIHIIARHLTTALFGCRPSIGAHGSPPFDTGVSRGSIGEHDHDDDSGAR